MIRTLFQLLGFPVKEKPIQHAYTNPRYPKAINRVEGRRMLVKPCPTCNKQGTCVIGRSLCSTCDGDGFLYRPLGDKV